MTGDTNTDAVNDADESSTEEQLQQEEHVEETTEEQQEKQQEEQPKELSLEEQLEAAQAEVAKLKDQMVRDLAETQNIRKRVQRDVENARKYALEKFIAELLPVVDNLERAQKVDNAEDEAVIPVLEGIKLTEKSLLDAMKKFNVEQIDPIGEPFDPQLHEAMAMVPNPEMEPNSVMDVMQKGYSLSGRLVRAAMVVVTKEA